jgi:hypothetical protein
MHDRQAARAEEVMAKMQRAGREARRESKPVFRAGDRVIHASGAYESGYLLGTVVGTKRRVAVRWDVSPRQISMESAKSLLRVDDVREGRAGTPDLRAWLEGKRVVHLALPDAARESAMAPLGARRLHEDTGLGSLSTVCPACGTENQRDTSHLGRLGDRDHYRCRSCGITYSAKAVGRPAERYPKGAVMTNEYRVVTHGPGEREGVRVLYRDYDWGRACAKAKELSETSETSVFVVGDRDTRKLARYKKGSPTLSKVSNARPVVYSHGVRFEAARSDAPGDGTSRYRFNGTVDGMPVTIVSARGRNILFWGERDAINVDRLNNPDLERLFPSGYATPNVTQAAQFADFLRLARSLRAFRRADASVFEAAYRTLGVTPDVVARTFSIDLEAAKKVVTLMRRPASRSDAYRILGEIDKLIKGHGVESLDDSDFYVDSYWRGAIAAYVNMGDTYTTTVLFDTLGQRFHLTSWGDFYEWAEQNREEYS